MTRRDVGILVVDDDADDAWFLQRLLKEHGYESIHHVPDAVQARRTLNRRDVGVMLTDMQMPGPSGLDLISDVRRDRPDVAAVMVTGRDDVRLAESALRLGAYGYVVKPFRKHEILISVSNALMRRDAEQENFMHRTRLENMVSARTSELWNAVVKLEASGKELVVSRRETIYRLARAAEYRDNETGSHIERMSRYCERLAIASGQDALLCDDLKDASSMHDVGKIGIPDSILLKPGRLTPEERATMQRHAEIGYSILKGSEARLLRTAASIAYTHHEWFDGSGYPRGLQGDEIPVEGRIAAICDVFDALTTNRIYRRAYPVAVAVDMMKREAGTHFDPLLTRCFWNILGDILDIKAAFDQDSELAPAL
ncbi:MAG: response regulator [Actinomycetota bacterium]|nr:response regulator [Actinomycetota bacterium]